MSEHERPPSRGLPLAVDPMAPSASNDKPAFIDPPAGSPVYYGFRLLDGVVVDGFALGLISDSMVEPTTYGDAFVVAPDGSRAGLIWEIAEQAYFQTTIGPDSRRFGVFSVGTTHGPTTMDEATVFLAEILPAVRREWERTRQAS